jgi:hypothetical protein
MIGRMKNLCANHTLKPVYRQQESRIYIYIYKKRLFSFFFFFIQETPYRLANIHNFLNEKLAHYTFFFYPKPINVTHNSGICPSALDFVTEEIT